MERVCLLTALWGQMARRGRERAIEFTKKILAWPLIWMAWARRRARELAWVRYVSFFRQDRINNANVLRLESERQARRDTLWAEEEIELNAIDNTFAGYEQERRESKEIIAKNLEESTDEREPLDYRPYDDSTMGTQRWLKKEDTKRKYNEKRNEIDSELTKARDELARYRTEFLTKEARIYAVPLPKSDDAESWNIIPNQTEHDLTTFGFSALRAAIRKERRDRWEYFQIRIALVVAICGLILGFANLLRK